MIAAIYARKSTEQTGVSDDAKSVTRQIEHARAFAASKGWTVADEHVYVDDAVSGALFGSDRPGLARLLNALKPRQFDVLIVSEVSRIGREMTQTAAVFGDLHRAGVRTWSYLDGREVQLESAIDKIMLSLSAFAAELEREKARQRTRDKMLQLARDGKVTGGRVFGYDNVRVNGHVERRINEAEAAVVRRIYELAALGLGLRAVAHTLNAERQTAPRPQHGRPAGWAPSSVREALGRPLYRGIIEYDRARRDSEGRQLRARQNDDPIRVPAEHLRIVPEALAAAVDAQRDTKRQRYQRETGHLKGGAAPTRVKHVLTGLLRCECGASYEATVEGRRLVYVCSAARRKGRAVCENGTRIPADLIERAVLDDIEAKLLSADVLRPALERTLDRITEADSGRSELEAEHVRLTRELSNLAAAVASGGDVQTLLAEMRRREARKAEIARELAQPAQDRESTRRALEATIADWRALLRGSPSNGRTVISRLVGGTIRIYRSAEGVAWGATGQPQELLRGLYYKQGASPTGADLPVSLRGPKLGGLLLAA